MAQDSQPENQPTSKQATSQSPDQDWSRLSPAIGQAKADDLLQARRQERGLITQQDHELADQATQQIADQTEAPASAEQHSAVAPWTSPLPAQARAENRGDDVLPDEENPAAQAPAEPAPTEPSPAAQRAEARDEAVQDRPRLLGLRRLIIALAVPVITIMLAVRAVASHLFLWAEYHRPGFPTDTYGFTTEERHRLGSYGLDYILNLAPESYLANIHSDGQPAFLPSEVAHMTDVKHVMLGSLTFALLTLIIALISARSLRQRAPGALRTSLFAGAWLTLGICLSLITVAIIGWEPFFTRFHQIFFPQGNWQFQLDDTLIRLYPPQFWIDAAATTGLIIVILTLVLLALTWPTRYRKQLALKRRAEREELKKILSK